MNKLKSLSLVALAAFGLSATGGTTTSEWWNVDFESPTPNDVTLEIGELGALTNDASIAQVTQPYTNGVWEMIDGDESYITNGLATNWVNGVMTEVNDPDNLFLKLDTQGNDLTWKADNTAVSNNIMALVDADLYLVGSDSAPDASDFDAGKDVHTAVYLKNETDETSGETTNSVLCVYVYDSVGMTRYWQELAGVELEDNAWAHVQVVVDYADASLPMVQVFVNGTQMHARDDATAISWPAAIAAEGNDVLKLSSVAFRGTGAVDNFVGTTQVVSYDTFEFTAEVYMDGVLVATGEEGNVTRTKSAEAGAGKTVVFPNYTLTNGDYEQDDYENVSWSLSAVEVINLANGTTTSYSYSWNSTSEEVDILDPNDVVDIDTEYNARTGTEYQTGLFSVIVPTDGATADATIVKIYFKTIGAFDAYATTTVGATTTTNAVTLKPAAAGGIYPTNLVWTFDAVQGGNLLTNIVLSNGATFDGYANGKATVKVTIDEALAADTLYAAASYVAGALADSQDLRPSTNGSEIVFAPYTPPVAVIGVAEYPSLRAAVLAATAGDTITLVRDDHVSFTEETPEIVINKALTIDGQGFTVYGVSAYNHVQNDGKDDHDIFISPAAGNVTIKDLKISEFGDTAPTVQYFTYPIWTSKDYAGKLTLDGVTIDKFARTAVNLNNGTFEITNCVFTGYAGDANAPARSFQNAITVKNAKGTVADTTATGIGSTADPWGAGLVTFNSNGDGEVTFLSGTYTADYMIEVSSNATGKAVFEGGVFIATADAGDSAFQLDEGTNATFTVEISGGWFDREPAAGYIAEGYKVVEDVPGAPVDGAYQHVVPDVETYDITFNDEDGTLIVTTNVAAGATAYAPADPTPAEGFTFVGWTNVLDAATVYTNASLPAAAGDATYAAKYEASAVQPPEVDAGDGLAGYNAAHAEDPGFTPVEPITFAVPEGGQDELCSLAFVATQPGWYYLYTSTTVTGPFEPDYTTKVQITDVGDLVRLTESAAGTSKFFKIGWSATEPSAE